MRSDYLSLFKLFRDYFLIILPLVLLPSQSIANGMRGENFSNLDFSVNLKSGTSYLHNPGIFSEFNITLNDHMSNRMCFLVENTEQKFDNGQSLQENSKPKDSTSGRLDPGVAFKRALFPGVIFHGSGHQYIGESGNGFLLTMTGLGSVALIIVGASEIAFDEKSDTDSIGDLYTKSDFGFWGINIFMGTWLFDIIAAPIKAQKHNKSNGFAFQLSPLIKDNNVLVMLYIK